MPKAEPAAERKSDVSTDDGAARVVVQRGLWFEELEVGTLYKHTPGRTITEADNTFFSTMTMNPQSLHLDAAASAGAEFSQRLVNSLLTMSVLVGQSVAHLTRGTTMANLGFSEVAFGHPVFHGDTLYGESVIIEKRVSQSRPGVGVVTFKHTARNQDGVVVAVATRSALIRRQPETVA